MKKHSIKSKQNNSKNCVVCGIGNDLSLKARFYETENNELVALFTPPPGTSSKLS